MSRHLEQNPDGTYTETIEDPEECRLLIDEVCCNADSPWLADFPGVEDCERCPLFIPEESNEEA